MKKIGPILGRRIIPGLPVFVKDEPNGTITLTVACGDSYSEQYQRYYNYKSWSLGEHQRKIKYHGVTTYCDYIKLTDSEDEEHWLVFSQEKYKSAGYFYYHKLRDTPATDVLNLWDLIKKSFRGYMWRSFLSITFVHVEDFCHTGNFISLFKEAKVYSGVGYESVHISVDTEKLFKNEESAYSVSRGVDFAMPELDEVILRRNMVIAYKRCEGYVVEYTIRGRGLETRVLPQY